MYILIDMNCRYIKMSSPHLNNLIIVGCMLTYMSVIFLGLDSSLSSIGTSPRTAYMSFISFIIYVFSLSLSDRKVTYLKLT